MGKSLFSSDALAGRTAFITGGGSGIGFGISRLLAAHGANVVMASRNRSRLDEACSAIATDGGRAHAITLDVRDYDNVSEAVGEAVSQFGGLDIMIANAAGNFVVPSAEMSSNAWRTVVDIDLNGTFHCARAAYESLKASPHGGRLIAISTMRALEGWPGCAHAAAAKAGIMSLIRTLAIEWGPDGIRANTVAPGAIGGTEGVDRIYQQTGRMAAELASIPLGHLGGVEDIARAVLYLSSDAGAYVTGTDLVVDGGRSRKRVAINNN